MRAVVTGGAGFIGSTLVDRLLAVGHEVSVIDNLSRGGAGNLTAVTPAVRLVAMDVRDPALTAVLAEIRPEVVFHLAAQIDVRASVLDPSNDASVNILGTINVAQAACAAGVRKIVFASSGGSVYGDVLGQPVPETHPVNPLSPYGVAKVAAELYLNTFSQLHGLHCTHLALANVYGPRQNARGEAGVVAIFARSLVSRQPTTIFGDGTNTRDYVYVQDVATAFLAAAGPVGDRTRYNIGTGTQVSDRELHSLVAAAAGAPDKPKFAPNRLGDVRASALDARLALRELGWLPNFTIGAGIEATVEHFRSAPVDES